MDFLLSHWHCVVPAVLIAAVLFIQSRKKQRDDE